MLKSKGGPICNIIFGKSAIGWIHGKSIPEGIVFKECIFNRVFFGELTKVTFINCEFYTCTFRTFIKDIVMRDCKGASNVVNSSYPNDNIYGVCEFINCSGIRFNGNINIDAKLTVENTPELDSLIDDLEEVKRKIEKDRLKNLELRKPLKYGYKIVYTPVLVKLSFPDETEFVNLDKEKSRANMAMVESIHIINEFGSEGVTNHKYKRCDYKVGEIVYPDSFDRNPEEYCGHGIHFYTDIQDLCNLQRLTDKQIESVKSIINEQ